ncbi:MAG: N-acetyltransferase [Chloroflexi bacterium]|nr:N-acetyltransferase [Chloroflexota bacterium]
MRQEEQIAAIVQGLTLPTGVNIRQWTEADFPEVDELSAAEGWNSPHVSQAQTLEAWQNSWPNLVAVNEGRVIGFLRAITDRAISTYITDLLVAPDWQRKGIARALLEVCHQLTIPTHFVLMAEEKAAGFYEADGFKKTLGYSKDFIRRIGS